MAFTSAAAILASGLACFTGPKAATPEIGVASMGEESAKPEWTRVAAASAKVAATLEVGLCAPGAGVAAGTATPGFGVTIASSETSEAFVTPLGWDIEYYRGSKPDQAYTKYCKAKSECVT